MARATEQALTKLVEAGLKALSNRAWDQARSCGRASGVELADAQATAGRMAHLFHVRGDKVIKLVVYFDRGRAITELGLAPEAGSTRE
jgi:hypothetical protein